MSTLILKREIREKDEKMIRIRLDDILNERGLTLRWLQDQTGIRYATLHALKSNSVDRVNLYHLYTIMNALGINDMNEILEIKDDPDEIIM